MIRLIKNITILFLCGILFYIGTLIADKQYLRDEILYIRIVYDSSIGIDQTDKSLLRNVFTSELSDIVFSEISFAAAREGIEHTTPQLINIVAEKLSSIGIKNSMDMVLVSEYFPVRDDSNFSLPAGVYKSLQINIAGAECTDWQRVVFPVFNQQNSGYYQTTAINSGMTFGTGKMILMKEQYIIRFKLLELIGKIENFFLNLLE